MEILTNLFGDPMPTAVKLILLTLALVAILLMVFWVFRKFVGSPAIKAARGRQPRLAVTDAANLDDKRRLVLVRRDDVEHLVMIGGANDILIESNIVRASSSRPVANPIPLELEPEAAIEIERPKSEQLVQGVAAVGAVAATAFAVSKPEAEIEPEVELSIEAPVDKEITTVEEIKEAAMADISLDIDDLDMGDVSLDVEDAPIPVVTETEQEMELSPEIVPDTEESEDVVDIPEIETGALSDLEDALGEELLDAPDITADQAPVVEPAVDPEPVIAVEEPSETEISEGNKPDMEDEMQKLLDELSGEKA